MRALALATLLAACGQPKPTVTVPAPKPTDPALAAAAPPPAPATTPVGLDLATLTANQTTHGFTATAVYTNAAGKPLGARFVHAATHFTFDYLRIETAPQGFIWVTSYPTSDKGEPHTQEHLLLGKGDRGRKFGSAEVMQLAKSSAFTAQYRTAYHFHTVADNAVYWPVFEDQLDTMLNPDYSDEEIRREVRNFGVDKADDGTLHLEEKGTVYNEMVRAYEEPDDVVERRALQLVYGADHPLAFESGGLPAAIRTMTPADIRAFHTANYHLANMGMIGAFPSAMPLADVLDRTSAILVKEAGRTGKVTTAADLPKPAGAPAGTTETVEYPDATAAKPGPLLLAWPAVRDLDLENRLALGVFLDALGSTAGTPLYQQLIDGKARVLDTGATGLKFTLEEDQGQPILLAIDGVRPDALNAATVTSIRDLVAKQLAHTAQLPPGDPELAAFDARVVSRITALRRKTGKLLDSPPLFGARGTETEWIDLLDKAQRAPGFTKSLVYAAQLDALEHTLADTTANPWTARITAWRLFDAPYGLVSRASPALRAQIDRERTERIAAELARLGAQYRTPTAKATLAKFAADEAVATAHIDELTRATPLPPLVDAPPMTRDPGLLYTTRDLGAAHVLTARFDSMASARVSFAFATDGIPPEDAWYLALLPRLLSDVGILDGTTAFTAADVAERVRAEVLDARFSWTASKRSGRVELVATGAGATPAETTRALGWLDHMMRSPDWRVENLPRLRDVVAQELAATRRRMTDSEERWVDELRDSWARQADAIYLHTSAFPTRAHDLHRLRWMLEDPLDPAATDEAAKLLTGLAASKALPRAQLADLAKQLGAGTAAAARHLSPKAAAIARDAGHDLAELLADLPDATLARDWDYLAREMAADLRAGAPTALAKLASVRDALFVPSRARIVVVGSADHAAAIEPALEAFEHGLHEPQIKNGYASTIIGDGPLVARLADHDPQAHAKGPRFIGYVAPATGSGVIANLAPSVGYVDPTDDNVLDYLATEAFSGHGAHSLFMKTWAAGLAYSNGVHPFVDRGEIDYYAERCPLLPQTLRFVIATLRAAIAAPPDPNIARYAVALAFDSRGADAFEARANQMSVDLADGIDPLIVAAFRTKILDASHRADLPAALWARVLGVYAKVMPGLGPLDRTATYFVIGPEKQLAAYAQYLKTAVNGALLHRVYPRDFWIPAKI